MRFHPSLPTLAALALASLVACSDSSDQPFTPNMPDGVPTPPTSQVLDPGGQAQGPSDETPTAFGKCRHSVHPRCE